MLDVGKKYLDASANVLNESWQYSYAAAEYTGLVVFSYIKRGSAVAACAIEPVTNAVGPKVFTPVIEATETAYKKTVSGLSSGFTVASQAVKKVFVCHNAKLEALDTRLTQLEERLSYLEKHGIIATNEGLHVKGKKLTEDRLMFLRNIVNENIDLLVEDKGGE